MEGNVAIARAMCADLKLLSKYKTFGKINAGTSIAYLLGPLMGGVMTDKQLFTSFTISTPFYFICILFLCLSILTQLILSQSSVVSSLKKQTFWQRLNFIKRLSKLFSNKLLKKLLLASTCFTLAVDIFYEFGPVYLTAKWTLTPTQLIVYNGTLCIGLAIGNGYLPGFISACMSNFLAMVCAICAFVLFLWGIVLSNSPFLILTWFALSGKKLFQTIQSIL